MHRDFRQIGLQNSAFDPLGNSYELALLLKEKGCTFKERFLRFHKRTRPVTRMCAKSVSLRRKHLLDQFRTFPNRRAEILPLMPN